MTEERKTLGEVIFGEEIPTSLRSGVGIGRLTLEGRFRQLQDADSIEEINERLFVLKTAVTHLERLGTVKATSALLEYVLRGLSERPYSISEIVEWREAYIKGNKIFATAFNASNARHFLKLYRERIGSMALNVFFEAVFERDKEAFRHYLNAKDASGYITSHLWHAEDKLEPKQLLVFLQYLARANDETKKGQISRIRRFLKMVLDEPLEPPDLRDARKSVKVGISQWSKDARHELACALVANGMYEECVDYNIQEAYMPLVYKFFGGLRDGDDGLLKWWPWSESPSYPHVPLSWEEALRKIRTDKNQRHLFSALVGLGMGESIESMTPLAFMEKLMRKFHSRGPAPAVQRREFVLYFPDIPAEPRDPNAIPVS